MNISFGKVEANDLIMSSPGNNTISFTFRTNNEKYLTIVAGKISRNKFKHLWEVKNNSITLSIRLSELIDRKINYVTNLFEEMLST